MQKCIWYSPRRFCFAAKHRNFCLLYRQKTQSTRRKKAYISLFFGGSALMTQTLELFYFEFVLQKLLEAWLHTLRSAVLH